jgi:hypothetical protein
VFSPQTRFTHTLRTQYAHPQTLLILTYLYVSYYFVAWLRVSVKYGLRKYAEGVSGYSHTQPGLRTPLNPRAHTPMPASFRGIMSDSEHPVRIVIEISRVFYHHLSSALSKINHLTHTPPTSKFKSPTDLDLKGCREPIVDQP